MIDFAVLRRRRRPPSYYQRTGQRIWAPIADYRAKPLNPRIAEALRVRRKELGLSQAEVALRTERRQGTISDLERGRRAPSLKLAERLIEVLQLGPELALQLRSESVLPRAKGAYLKPWLRGRDYQPAEGRKLGVERAASPSVRERAWEAPKQHLPVLVGTPQISFRTWRR